MMLKNYIKNNLTYNLYKLLQIYLYVMYILNFVKLNEKINVMYKKNNNKEL